MAKYQHCPHDVIWARLRHALAQERAQLTQLAAATAAAVLALRARLDALAAQLAELHRALARIEAQREAARSGEATRSVEAAGTRVPAIDV